MFMALRFTLANLLQFASFMLLYGTFSAFYTVG